MWDSPKKAEPRVLEMKSYGQSRIIGRSEGLRNERGSLRHGQAGPGAWCEDGSIDVEGA